MRKIYCDKCGKEVNPSELIKFSIDFKPFEFKAEPKSFDICPECAAKFSDWLKGKCACQKQDKPAEQEAKKTNKPADKPAKEGKSLAYTAQQIAWLAGAPVTTARRHAEGICSTYRKDKQGRTVRCYHLTDDQLSALIERIKSRKQGQRTKI